MKKIGLIICLAVVLTLGIGGVGFGWWSETLDIGQNPITTGEFNVTFCNGPPIWYDSNCGGRYFLRGVISNDDAVNYEALWCNGEFRCPVNPDPDDNGGDPTAHQNMGVGVNRIENMASTTASGDGTRTITVSISNAYPSYYATIFFSIRNWGSIPAKVQSIKVTEVSYGTTTIDIADIPLEVCTPVPLDCDGDGDSDLALHLSNDRDALLQDIFAAYGAHGTYASAVCGNLGIHVEEGAAEGTTYDFTVEIVAVPFNTP